MSIAIQPPQKTLCPVCRQPGVEAQDAHGITFSHSSGLRSPSWTCRVTEKIRPPEEQHDGA
jgi:hypothetical protein